jgi:hypothetical protein
MLYTLLSLTGTVLLLTFAASYMILRAAITERPLRKVLLFFVITTPFIAVFALIRTLVSQTKPIRYNEELGRIEDEIENERVSTFGGAIMRPSFSERWRMSYMYAIERSAATAIKLDPSLDRSLSYGITRLRG